MDYANLPNGTWKSQIGHSGGGERGHTKINQINSFSFIIKKISFQKRHSIIFKKNIQKRIFLLNFFRRKINDEKIDLKKN